MQCEDFINMVQEIDHDARTIKRTPLTMTFIYADCTWRAWLAINGAVYTRPHQFHHMSDHCTVVALYLRHHASETEILEYMYENRNVPYNDMLVFCVGMLDDGMVSAIEADPVSHLSSNRSICREYARSLI